MVLGNERNARAPSGYRVAPMSYEKLEDVAIQLQPFVPTTDSKGWRVDALRVLERMLPQAGFQPHIEDVSELQDCAAFTIPDHNLVVLRRDVYDGLETESVFSRSTVIHELSHIVLNHAVTLRRGPPGAHRFFEDSEWQAKALTAAIMMSIGACEAAKTQFDLATMCGVSAQAAGYRLAQLTKCGRIKSKVGRFTGGTGF